MGLAFIVVLTSLTLAIAELKLFAVVYVIELVALLESKQKLSQHYAVFDNDIKALSPLYPIYMKSF